MRRILSGLIALAVFGTHPLPLAAQGRDAQIRSAIAAYDNFETARALSLLQTALNPSLGDADSLWFRGAQFLVQILFEENQPDLARTWARWATRLAPNAPLDTLQFLSDVVETFRTARADVASEQVSGDVVNTIWEWPATAPPTTESGRLRVTSGLDVPDLRVLVVGRGLFTLGQIRTLPAGSYTVEVSAAGYETARVTREVLPGVLTDLVFRLAPVSVVAMDVLPDDVRREAEGRFVRLSVSRFGTDAACAAGVLAGRDGLVLTSYRAIRGASGVRATLGSGQEITDGIVVLAHDVGSDLAALALPVLRRDSLPLAPDVARDQYVWGLGADPGCAAPRASRFQVANVSTGTFDLSDSLSGAAVRHVLVNARGAITGIPVTARRATGPIPIGGLLSAARRNAAGGASRSVVAVARAENHAYGAIELSADVSGALATVTPLEAWHWPELRWTGALPHRYAGPQGRYRLEVSVAGVQRDQREFVLQAAVTDRLAVRLREAVEEAAPQVAAGERRGGGFPWIIAVVGAAGAGAAAFLLGGGEPPPNGPDGDTGTITVRVPNN